MRCLTLKRPQKVLVVRGGMAPERLSLHCDVTNDTDGSISHPPTRADMVHLIEVARTDGPRRDGELRDSGAGNRPCRRSACSGPGRMPKGGRETICDRTGRMVRTGW